VTRRRTVVLGAVLALLSLRASVVGAAPLAESLRVDARRDYDRGRLLASDGDYAGAVLKFQAAYEASHDPRLLWNVAFCEKQLRHYARVLALLKRYEDEGKGVLTANDRREAHDLAAALVPFTTTARIAADQPGAEVFVDDERVGIAPLPSAVVVDIGTHVFRATKPGFLEARATVPIGGGVDVPVSLHLEPDVHQGKIIVHAAAGATIVIDGESLGTGSAEKVLATGGHQLVVQEPGWRTFRSEVVVADHETRSLEVMLERLSDAELPRIRVAVGCVDARPRSATEGLAVYLDGNGMAASPIEVHPQWVAYPALPGPHAVELRAPGCVPAHLTVNVRDPDGSQIDGALPPVHELQAGGTAGSPDGWSLALGAWYGALVQNEFYADVFGSRVSTIGDPRNTSIAAIGPTLDAALTRRWLTLHAVLSAAWGDTSGTATGIEGVNLTNNFGQWSTTASLAAYRVTLRAGPRLPLGNSALSAGVDGTLGVETVSGSQYQQGVSHVGVLGGVWAAFDVKWWCDWGVAATFDDDLLTTTAWRGLGGALALTYQPSARCRGVASTDYGVSEEKAR
jgi:PEGA domain